MDGEDVNIESVGTASNGSDAEVVAMQDMYLRVSKVRFRVTHKYKEVNESPCLLSRQNC